MKLANMLRISVGGGIALVCAATALPAQAFTIDTTPGESGRVTAISENPRGISLSSGQTFIAPSDRILDEFSFFLFDSAFPGEGASNFRAFVAAFDSATNTLASPILFESSPITAQFNVRQTLTFNTGGLALDRGREYIAFLSPLKDLDGIFSSAELFAASETVASYEDAGGRYVFSQTNTFSDLATRPFLQGSDTQDLAFRASFSSAPTNVIPEPATILGTLVFGSLGGTTWLKRRKKAK